MIDPEKWQELNDRMLIMRLTQKRLEAGLTQEDLAAAAGCTVDAISFFEGDENDPYLSTIRRYAAAVGAIYEIRVGKVAVPEEAEDESPPCGRSGCLHNCSVCVAYYDGQPDAPEEGDERPKKEAWVEQKEAIALALTTAGLDDAIDTDPTGRTVRNIALAFDAMLYEVRPKGSRR